MKWIYYDMFSGISGFHLGLKWAGFEFEKVYYSDIDKYANKIYALRFPESIPLGDITKVKAESLGQIDIVTAGFPCQDLSVAGKQKGIHGERSNLFNEIIRVCRVCRPKYIILENVANLISRPEWIGYVLGRLSEIGYDAEWEIIRASDIGAPHRRARIWIVAYSQRRGCGKEGEARELSAIHRERKNNSGEAKKSGNDVSHSVIKHGNNGRYDTSSVCRKQQGPANISRGKEDVANSKRRRTGRGNVWRNRTLPNDAREMQRRTGIETNDSRKWWATESDVGRVAHGIPNRVDRLKCLGNSIVPQIACYIGKCILQRELLKG